ncbi:MAG: tRNA (adenosine(37)-N6)-threonylcarbamoyltransferase complex dimerization subunit type 1 TsaB [Anaeroplasmataceae bacterium]|nr:tRNA (adenosine(37)-N6)-threonylcarbamoyltransferase complex dimerization subunit type 1 TsaB [Anaeroplasmataceae bacterium]
MRTLIIDSATNILYTALCENDLILYESYVNGKNDHARAILVEVQQACDQASLELSDIDQVIVGYGPGSYTGVRMGVTVGKMIATLKPHIKLYAISTLYLMASGYNGRVLASIDARRGNCFGCIYDFEHDKYEVSESLVVKEDLLKNPYDSLVTEQQFKVNPHRVITHASLIKEPRLLVPNYLRETEAERNLNA